MIRPLALDALRMAQDVELRQGFRVEPYQRLPDCGSGWRQTGHCFSFGLTSRLALHLGQVTLTSLISGSLVILPKGRERMYDGLSEKR